MSNFDCNEGSCFSQYPSILIYFVVVVVSLVVSIILPRDFHQFWFNKRLFNLYQKDGQVVEGKKTFSHSTELSNGAKKEHHFILKYKTKSKSDNKLLLTKKNISEIKNSSCIFDHSKEVEVIVIPEYPKSGIIRSDLQAFDMSYWRFASLFNIVWHGCWISLTMLLWTMIFRQLTNTSEDLFVATGLAAGVFVIFSYTCCVKRYRQYQIEKFINPTEEIELTELTDEELGT